MLRRPLLVAVALTAALAPAGAAEGAPSVKTARFVAYVEGKQVTTWNVPRYNTYFDCQGQRWSEGGGREAVMFRTKPARILVLKNPGGTQPIVRVGTWSLLQPPKSYFLSGRGQIERTGRRVDGLDPDSRCYDAGDPTEWDHGPYDCGTRPFDPEVTMNWRAGRVEIAADDLVVPLDGSTNEFTNCPIEGPIEPFEGQWTKIGQRYPVRHLFDSSQGLVEVLGRKTWTEEIRNGHGKATTVTTFKLRLRRAR